MLYLRFQDISTLRELCLQLPEGVVERYTEEADRSNLQLMSDGKVLTIDQNLACKDRYDLYYGDKLLPDGPYKIEDVITRAMDFTEPRNLLSIEAQLPPGVRGHFEIFQEDMALIIEQEGTTLTVSRDGGSNYSIQWEFNVGTRKHGLYTAGAKESGRNIFDVMSAVNEATKPKTLSDMFIRLGSVLNRIPDAGIKLYNPSDKPLFIVAEKGGKSFCVESLDRCFRISRSEKPAEIYDHAHQAQAAALRRMAQMPW